MSSNDIIWCQSNMCSKLNECDRAATMDNDSYFSNYDMHAASMNYGNLLTESGCELGLDK